MRSLLLPEPLIFTLLVCLFSGFALQAQEGSVGIGTTTPSNANKLEVKASAGQQALLVNSTGDEKALRLRKDGGAFGARLNFGDSQYTWLSEDSDDLLSIHSDEGIIFSTFGQTLNERMRLTKEGQLYFPTVIDASSNNGNINIGNSLFLDDNELVSTGTFFINASNSGSTAGVNICSNSADIRMSESGGRVRIGENAENFGDVRLQVGVGAGSNSAARFKSDFGSNNGFIATVHITNDNSSGAALWLNSGFAAKPGGGDWVAASDERLKENVGKYKEGLDQIKKIRTVTFNYNGKSDLDTEKQHIGIIAQELQKVAPHMIIEGGEYLMVDPSAFTYMLINAVQEQDQIIQDQKKEIDELKARLDRIEALLSKE